MDRARILLKKTDRRTDKKIPIYPKNFVFNYTPRNEIAMGIMFKLVRQSVSQSASPVFFLFFLEAWLLLKPLHGISWNFVDISDTMSRSASYQEIQILIFLWEFRSFISVLLNLKVCFYIKYSKEQFVTLTALQMLHGL